MKKFYIKNFLLTIFIVLGVSFAFAQQVPNAGFEDWSGAEFDGNIQPASWNVSNIEQVGIKFNLTHREAGHSGSYSLMVQDTKVGALGITEISPGYFSLGKPWSHLEGIDTKTATAGTSGGLNFTHRPDSMSVWIKRTGSNVDKENFYLLYYAWSGTSKGSKYKAKNGSCTSISQTNEESDIRLALDANECGTDQKANQIAEGLWYEKKAYGDWTNIRVPIYYFNNEVPTMMNIIFSASNYPNFRANSGLYEGNALYVDDVEMIYSSKIQKLFIGGKEWKGFDPNSTEEQNYSLGRTATTIPDIKAYRGVGSLTNAKGTTVQFSGRELSGGEISITNGSIDGEPSVITVKSEDGKSTTVYKIKFVREASKNAKLNNIYINGNAINNFQPGVISYNYQLPYGTQTAPEVTVDKQEDEQTVDITQPNSVNGTATIKVTAADKKTTNTYTINFSVALLSDNTLKDIKVNGVSIAGFTPTQTAYRVSLPTSTNSIPSVEAVSAYPAGEQTITQTAPTSVADLDGSQHTISVTTPGNQTPKTYRLTYKLEASSYSLLKSLQMGDNLITNFDPNQFTYYVNLPIGSTELPKITYEKGESTQTVTVQEGGLNGVSKVTVVAGNGFDQSEYKIVVATAKSEISSLNMIYVGGVALEGFDPTKTSYTYTLPIGTTELPAITYDKGDEYQKVNMTTGGINGTTRLVVTAENGSSTIYQITFSVYKATNATLKMIYLDGQPLDGFDPNILEYHCPLPQGTTVLPVITYDQADEYQTVTVRSGGVNGDYRITVRPQSGTSQTYILHFSVATSDNASLNMIYLDGKPLDGFDPAILNYVDTLPMGQLTPPTVTVDKGDETQKVLNICSNNVQTIKVTAESGKVQTYTIQFVIQRSNSAFLKMIYLDGDSLVGFDKNTFEYTVSLTGPTSPRISVDKEDGQQVTITAPYAVGQAKIEVRPESGAPNTYIINFVNVSSNTALLKNIYIDGVALTGFSPNVFEYNVNCSSATPNVTYQAEADQKVTIFRQNNTITLYVVAGNNNAQYLLNIHTQALSDCTLRNITINGATIVGFASNEYNYTISINENEVPVIGFEKQYAEQTVYAGMLDVNTYSLLVRAQNGDTARYTIDMTRELSNDANLINLVVEGYDISFQPTKYQYTLTLAEGLELPDIQVTAKEGQSTELHYANDSEQQVIVIAADGVTKNTYSVLYNRNKSNSALLADILVDGVSLAGFNANVFAYTDTLAWRTKVVPCVQPIGAHLDQVITTYHSAVDGTTKIHVVAADGITTQDYSVYFPVIKSNNTALKTLDVDGALDFTFNPNVLNYTVTMPYGTNAAPSLLYDKSENEQNIELVAAPLHGTTKLIITAENGDQRTYSLNYIVEESTLPNTLKSISVDGVSLDLTQGNEIEVVLPYGTTDMSIAYEKNFAEQTVTLVQQGAYKPTKIVVYSNRDGELPTTYTIIPKVTSYNPATLNNISLNGTSISNFKPNQYSYVVNVDDIPEIGYTAADGVTVTEIESDNKHIVYQVTSGEYSNIYSIYYYYQNDVIPSKNFTETATTLHNGKAKPAGWMVPADCADKYEWGGFLSSPVETGPEVSVLPDGVVHLSTWRNGDANSIYGSIPGIMTIGTLSLTLTSGGNSTSSVSGGIQFRNTPEQIAVDYRTTSYSKMDNWRLWVELSDGTNTVPTLYEGSHEPVGQEWQSMVKDLDYEGLGLISKMNLTVNSAHSDNAKDLGGSTKRLADMDIRNLRFIYNSKLTSVTVDGNEATITGNTITYHIEDAEYSKFPELMFIGEKADQMPVVTWENEVNGTRTAQVRNYGEDGSYTDYELQITRPLSAEKQVASIIINNTSLAGFHGSTNEYTYVMPNGYNSMPSVSVIAKSTHQSINILDSANVILINVTAENGETNTYTVHLTESKSNNTELASIIAEGIIFAAETREYHISGTTLPEITFTKLSDGQTVTLNKGIITVEAEDGTIGAYHIILDKPNTTGQLSDIEANGISLPDFSSSTYEYTADKPETIGFKRIYESDSVVFVQTPLYMEWQVFGTESHTYRITYPSELSSNTNLEAIYIDDVLYEAFNENIYEYEYKTDEPIHLYAVANAKASALDMDVTTLGDTTIYTYIVTAENGTKGTPYTFTVVPNLSSWAYLQSITLNGTPISGFRADSLQYRIILPAGEYKIAEPTIPSIAYQLGATRQQVSIEHGGLGEETTIVVVSEDGANQNAYSLFIEAELSHCVSLSGIAVNGEPIEHFESQRHYYSVKCNDENIDVTWSSNDNFQTVTETYDSHTHTLHVVAQDGVSNSDYIIEIYKENASADVTLKDILLDGMSFDLFEPSINEDLSFSAMQQRYNINLPAGTISLPEICALLNSEGQKVNINIDGWKVDIQVTAPDGVSTNTYSLRFSVPRSNNALLKMIYLDGIAMDNFLPGTYKYDILLPVGQIDMPDVYAEPQEATQTVLDSITSTLQRTIYVIAEDGTENQYYLTFLLNPSQEDQLEAIYGDGELIEGFAKNIYNYAYTLPVGTDHIPTLTWDVSDNWQTVNTDTIINTPNKQITQIHVTAGSGKKNIYTVSYEILLSSVDTLDQIYVGADSLDGYNPYTTEYYISLSAGDSIAPIITWQEGDSYQIITPNTSPYIINGVQIGWKTTINVQAQNGHTRIYSLYFLFTPVVSTNTELLNIYLNGAPMENFDPTVHTYRITVPYGESKPSVLATAAEPAQTITYVHGDTTYITVTAEDRTTTDTYTLIFVYQQSSYAYLEGIFQDGELIEGFRADSMEYNIVLPYGTTTLPTFTYTLGIAGQTVSVDTIISNNTAGQTVTYYSFIVTAPDEETFEQYDVYVTVALNDDCSLQSLLVSGVEIEGFHSDTTAYQIIYPIGTDSAALVTKEAILPITNDPSATFVIYEDGYDFTIIVTANDGIHSRVYTIEQIIALSSNTLLKSILIDSVTLRDFAPEVLEYTYYVGDAQPSIEAIAEDSTATVEYSMYAVNEPFYIYVTAQDGSEQIYTIYFVTTTIESSRTPSANDVLIKHLGGHTFGAATLRKNVSIGIYNLEGHLVFYSKVAESSQNDVVLGTNAYGEDCLINVHSTTTQFDLPGVNQTFFYVFFENDKNRIASGKLVVTP